MPAPPRSRRPASPRRASQPARVLSRDVILDAAMEILDHEGLDAVTMRRVADGLDTGPASLYAHVEHKDDLVDGLLDRVIGEIDISAAPDASRWQDQLKQFARDIRTVYARHSDIARASLGTIPTGPHALPVIEWMLSVVRSGGVSDQVAAWTADILSLFAGAVAYEEALERVMYPDDRAREEMHRAVHDTFLNLDTARFPTMAALAGALVAGDGDERFEFGLDILVRGVASTVEPVGRPARRRTAPTR